MIPNTPEDSGSPTSSCSTSTQPDDVVEDVGGKSLEKTVSFSSWAATRMGEIMHVKDTDNNSEPELLEEALQRLIKAKVCQTPSFLACSVTVGFASPSSVTDMS